MKLEHAFAALRFEPALPWWMLGALGLLCLLVLLPALVRRARGGWWRALAFVVLLGWLAGPRLVQETRDTLPDIALLVVDHSASMRIGERASLAERARVALEREAAALPGLELRAVEVPEQGHDGTRLFAAIGRALAEVPRTRLAGIVALTDGQAHDAPDAPLPAPLHVLIPARGEETDRRLRVVEAPGFGLVDKSVTLRVAVEDLGVPPDPAAEARIAIRRDGEPSEIRSVPVGRPVSIEVPITHAGPTVVEVRAAPLAGEVSTLNNSAVVTINGVRDRLRVLLVSGEPHQGERTWRRLLKADPAVDLVHFTILRPPDRDDATPLNELALIAFPVRELFQVKIREFDLIILDRFQNRNILPPLYLRNIADYVRAGGGLLLSAGPEFTGATSLAPTPLGTVLPVRPAAVVEGAFRPQVTALGARHPVTAGLPGWHDGAPPDWGSWYRHISVTEPGRDALLATPDGAPLLLLDHVGEGRVATLLSDQIWLWSRGHQGGGPQAELLRRIAHWLMKEPALDEEALRAVIADGTLHVERRSLQDHPAESVVVTAPSGATTPVTLAPGHPGTASAELPAPEQGVYLVSDGTRTAFAAASLDNPREYADLRATASVLGATARQSGGSTRFLGNGIPELRRVAANRDASGSGWIGLPYRRDHVVTGLDSAPLLPAWAALPLLLVLVVLAWRRES